MHRPIGTSRVVWLLLERAFGQGYLDSLPKLIDCHRCILVLCQDSMKLMNYPFGESAVPCNTIHHKFDRGFLVSQQID